MTLDGTITELLWHYYGVFLALAVAGLFTRLKMLLRGHDRRKRVITITVGILMGFCSIGLLVYQDPGIEFIDRISDCPMIVRFLVYAPIFFLYPLALGLFIDAAFRWYCPPWSIMCATLLTAFVLEGYHVWWQWLKGATIFFFFAYS